MSTGDSLQVYEHTVAENERMEKDFPCKMRAGTAILISDKMDFK